jgi:16S rRNA (cytosine1402-N4)-methyltransferase
MAFFSTNGEDLLPPDHPHRSVLLDEVKALFAPVELRTFIDGTLGAGGHSAALLEAHPSLTRLIGIDRDDVALNYARERLSPWGERVTCLKGNFSSMASLARSQGLEEGSVDGILVDLGVSSMQLDTADRGFSFMREGPLDMRMGQNETLTAATIVNTWTEEELRQLFWRFGEEPQGRLAARLIVAARPLHTTTELAAVLRPLERRGRSKIHPATRVFQAIRIAVNGELQALADLLPQALKLLRRGGVLAIISFHSLEDRPVKEFFRSASSDKEDTRGLAGLFINKIPQVKLLTRKPLIANEEEQRGNPRARSAKMRAVEKL